MTLADTTGRFFDTDTWAWWQARRLRYTLALGAAGWLAYAVTLALFYGFGQPMWSNWRDAFAATLILGTLYLVVIGAANVAYLLGPAVEAWARPAEVERYRKGAFAMGFWGSVALPFAVPLICFAMLVASSAGGD